LSTVTYSEPTVVDEISQRFAPAQVNVQEDAARLLIERYRQVWTPDLRLLAPDGFELYRWNGYLPPFEFVPQLLVAHAHGLLRLDDPDRAATVYDEVLRRFPTSAVAPEAQYFLAVSKYKASHEGSDLLGGWKQLQARFPDSIWRVRQSFTEAG
jgi:hypothetical protein